MFKISAELGKVASEAIDDVDIEAVRNLAAKAVQAYEPLNAVGAPAFENVFPGTSKLLKGIDASLVLPLILSTSSPFFVLCAALGHPKNCVFLLNSVSGIMAGNSVKAYDDLPQNSTLQKIMQGRLRRLFRKRQSSKQVDRRSILRTLSSGYEVSNFCSQVLYSGVLYRVKNV